MKRNAIFGGILWAGILALSRTGFARLTIIESLFLLGPLVVVPLGLELRDRASRDDEPRWPGRIAHSLQFPAALCVVASFWIPPGPTAAILVLPWFALGCVSGMTALGSLVHTGYKQLETICWVVSFFYLPVGCAWLAASRLGLTPMGFHEPIVLLTAVHFHFAGFAAPLLLLAVALEFRTKTSAAWRLFRVVAAGVLAGPGLLAAGFVIGPRVKLAMAILVSCSEAALSLFFLVALRNLGPRKAQAFVAISAFSALFAMALAAIWAVGEFPFQPLVHLDEVARFHGTANSVGFILCGLIGWSLAQNRALLGKEGAR
jgi:hypothetical protein